MRAATACIGCGADASGEARVYFGVAGPYCSVRCRDLTLRLREADRNAKWCECPSKEDAGYRDNGWIVCGRCKGRIGGGR